MFARTHGKGQGISMSFRGMGKSLPMGTRSKDRQRPESRCRPYIGMSFRLAIPWLVALQQSQLPLRQLGASVPYRYFGVEQFSVNGTLSLNCLSHSRGQVHLSFAVVTWLHCFPHFVTTDGRWCYLLVRPLASQDCRRRAQRQNMKW